MSAAVKNETCPGGRVLLSAEVKAKSGKNDFWKEKTELISMSRSGAGFYLESKCEVGRLVSLLMPMPKHLRCYDFEKELYRVWGLVQHCSPVSGGADSAFHVGVAFVGKNAPASYKENPHQSYRIAGMNENGMWRIVEAKADFVIRRQPRHWLSLEVLLAAWNDDGKLILDETAKTENISVSGAAVFSNMKIDVGDSVTFDSIQHNFSSLAIVRNCQTLENELPRLHLEFINGEFPVEELNLPNEKDIFDDE
jgi:hypothetical protein